MYEIANVVTGFLSVVGVLAAIALTILLYIKVLPAAKDGTLGNKCLQLLHDYFNFKKLYIETVLKFIFTLATITCVIMGVVGVLNSLVAFFGSFGYLFDYGSGFFGYILRELGVGVLSGVLTAALGPVVLRLVYEGVMMFIIMVKNVIEINQKTEAPAPEQSEE